MSGLMLELLEIYVTACERQEQEVEEALKEVEALHLSLCTAQQHFPTADLAAKPTKSSVRFLKTRPTKSETRHCLSIRSTDNQSVDRAYRIGQNKDVIVYRLITCGTVEEKIYRKQIYKGGLFKTATEHKQQIRYSSQQDLRELFSLPKEGFDVSLTQQQLYEEHGRQHTMAEYAFKPKDAYINKKPSSPIDADKLTASEIKQRINRLSQTLANKAMVSRLPDKGEKIQKQIGEPNAELYRLGKVEAQGNERNVIDLELNDDVTGEFQKSGHII